MQPLPRYRLYSKPGDYASIVREVVARRWLRGENCSELERAIEELGAAHAICVAKARVGIFLAVRAILRPGQKVVLSPYTISDVVNMVICAGGVPVFADTERETCNIDPSEIDRLVDSDTGAVLVTHLHGLSCDMDRISTVCRESGVPLIEDAAQAFGCRFQGRLVGTFGDAGIYSFGMYKNVNSFFGGMLVIADASLAQQIRTEVDRFPAQEIGYYLSKVLGGAATDLATLPALFKSITYPVFRFGFLHDVAFLNQQTSVDTDPQIKRVLPESYLRRLTHMQARLVLRQLGAVDEQSRARVRTAEMYHAGLRDIPEVVLPPLRTDLSHIYTYFPIQVTDRDALLRQLMREHRDVAAQHLKNCADLPCFEEFQRECPNARENAGSVVLLPTYPRYGARDAEQNMKVIRRYFGRS